MIEKIIIKDEIEYRALILDSQKYFWGIIIYRVDDFEILFKKFYEKLLYPKRAMFYIFDDLINKIVLNER